MSEKETKQEGKNWVVSNGGRLQGFLEQPKRKSYSVVAMNLETVEDVEKVIHQCELIRQEITGGCEKWDSKRFMDYFSQKNREV